MFQYKADFEAEYCGARSVAESRLLNPELMTFAAWLSKYKSRIPLSPKRRLGTNVVDHQ
jgi:hypothetical protein